jgi:hypothetical protein
MAAVPMKRQLLAGSVAAALVIPAVVLAQPGPRILPARPDVQAEPLPGPDAELGSGSVPGPAPDAPLPPEPRSRSLLPPRASSIEIGNLGTVEGPVAGLMDDGNGGLGAAMWQGMDRATAIAMMHGIPPATPSEAQRLLLRKLLLTAAPPPGGASDESFNALRLTKLIDAGMVEEAADLALKIDAPNNPDIQRAQAEALILAGRDEMCGDLTKRRLDSAEPFWAELRAYCYAASNDPAYDLTRSVLDDQGIVDPAFLILLDGVTSGKGAAPEVIHLPDSLQLMMLQKLKLPVPPEIESALGLSGVLAVAGSAETPRAARIAAAETAMRAGVLPTPLLAQILDTYTFTPQALAGAPAIARSEPSMSALARLRAALKAPGKADARAELIHAALEVGQREGVLGQVALLFADDATAIFPPRDWGNWSELMLRGLLLAGQPDAAARWQSILNPDQAAIADMTARLSLTLALAAPDIADPLQTQAAMTLMARRSASLQPPPSPALLAQTTLCFGLFDALGRPMPQEAKDEVASLMNEMPVGRRPAPALMQRIDRAANARASGELALSVLAALGQQGVRDLAPDIIVRLVRALKQAGIQDAADALAMEAMLLRPATGI